MPALSKQGCKDFTQQSDYWWARYTNCISFSRRPPVPPFPNIRLFHTFQGEVQTDGVSVSVLMFQPQHAQPPPTLARKRKRQRQTSTEWVKDLPDRHIDQTHRIVGLDPGRKSLFTAAIHSQSAAGSLQDQRTHESTPDSKYTTMSWSSSRWREASGIKFRLHKTQLWFSRNVSLKSALEDTPSAKVATVALLMKHVQHRMRYEAAAVSHFGDRRHRQLRWRTFMKQQQAYSAICRAISAGSQDTVVAYGTPALAAAVTRATQAHRLCLCAETWAIIARSLTQMSFALADYAVHARAPWMACLCL